MSPTTLEEVQRFLEEQLQKSLTFSPHGPYPLPTLGLLINCAGDWLDHLGDCEGKDDEFDYADSFTEGITTGEWCYSLERTLTRMIHDVSFAVTDLPVCDLQVLGTIVDGATGTALERIAQEESDLWEIGDLWALYKWCMKLDDEPLWHDEANNETAPPPLEQFTQENWKQVADGICIHFQCREFADYETRLVLLDDQPHWPTFQEFRKSKAGLFAWVELLHAIRENPPGGVY
jgi:hypothetical protein